MKKKVKEAYKIIKKYEKKKQKRTCPYCKGTNLVIGGFIYDMLECNDCHKVIETYD
jgi:transposase-like protein